MLMEITFKGSPVTLCGKQLCPGDRMPNFTLTDRRLQAVYGRELTGIRVFLTVPSRSEEHTSELQSR